MDKKHIVLVLGMHRSGTSAIARALVALGYEIGNNLLPANNYNQTGYWEDRDIVSINDRLLATLGHAYDSVSLLPKNIMSNKDVNTLKEEALELLAGKMAESSLRVIKDPRMCRLLSFWQSIFAELDITVDYVIQVRNPLSVADSLQKRDRFAPQKSLQLWLLHNVEAVLSAQGNIRYFVDYDAFLNDPRRHLSNLASALGLSDRENLEAGIEDYMDNFLNVSLRHTQYGIDDLRKSEDVSVYVMRAYELLLSACKDKTVADDDEFIGQWRELNVALENNAPLLAYLQDRETLLKEKWSNRKPAVVSSLYWRCSANPNFTEANKIDVNCGYAERAQTLSFQFPLFLSDVTGLRFDMADCPASIEIESMALLNAEKEEVWRWNGDPAVFNGLSNDLLMYAGQEQGRRPLFISIGNDPFAHVRLPEDVLAQVAPGWQFVVESMVNAPSVHSAEFLSLLSRRDQVLIDDKNTIQTQQEEIAQLREELNGIKGLQQEYADEISRAEDQLALLQDVMNYSLHLERQLH